MTGSARAFEQTTLTTLLPGDRAAVAAVARHRGRRIGDADRGDRRAGGRRAALCGEPDPGLCAVLHALHHVERADRHGQGRAQRHRRASRSASRCCSPASATSGTIRSCSAPSRSTCSPSSSAACIALLPVFARDVFHAGPWGLGLLRASPGVGALIAAVILAHRPPRQQVGRIIFGAVAIYGVAIIVFALSRLVRAVDGAARRARRRRHDQRRHPHDADPARNPRRHARPRQRGELAVRDRVEPARRFPRRPDGGLARHHSGGAGRRHRRAARGADRAKGVRRSSTGSRPSNRRR